MKLLCILSRDFAEFPADNRRSPGAAGAGKPVEAALELAKMKLTLRPAVLAALT